MRPTKFKIESLGYETFDGFTLGEDWNGWACPYFTFEQAQKVLKNFNELRKIIGQKNLAFYDCAIDAFVFPVDEDEPEVFAAVVKNKLKYYPLGAFCWIWEESEE
jgi:hypothetical protein